MKSLVVNKLNKHFGKHHVLKDVSFSLQQGEIVGFIGPNGTGKSTTMKCIANLIFPDSGEINIAGYDLAKSRNKALGHLSALIEAPGLYYNLSGMDNLRLFAKLRGVPKERIQEVIEFTGLGNRLQVKANKYSMGMKQRLALGIAVLTQPTFLILDEPFSGLDPHAVNDLKTVIKKLATEGCGVIFSSHQIGEMEKIAHRHIFIKDGMIVQEENELEGSMTSYRLLVAPGAHDLSFLEDLKEAEVLTDFYQEGKAVIITLSSAEHLPAALTTFLTKGPQISGIIPLSTDLENLYQSIYGQGEI